MKKYNKYDKNSIYEYATNLIGKTFREVEVDYFIEKNKADQLVLREDGVHYGAFRRKGGLGDLLEDKYFEITTGNESLPDFVEADMELKVTPYRINKNKTLSAKERLVITMIDYFKIVEEDFYSSHLWPKIEFILLIYYLYEQDKERLDYIIDYVYMYSPNKQDLKIIIEDYNKIKSKISRGEAHLLSEGDTLYLGAVTKSATSANRTSQPFSDELAKPRAFSLKTSYMTTLLRERISQVETESIVKDEVVEDFEQYIVNKIDENKGLTKEQLIFKYYGKHDMKSKNIYNMLTYKMLGVNGDNALEFEKANIEVKTIRLNERNTITESMSFPAFNVLELLEEEWEESTVFDRFSATKFLFVVYKKVGKTYVLHGSMFWNMPVEDLEGQLKLEWERTYNIFKEGVKLTPKQRGEQTIVSSNLPKLSNTEILHVRNHSQKSVYVIDGIKYGNGIVERDGDLLPNGDIISKQCFWLNNKYILKQISKIIHNT